MGIRDWFGIRNPAQRAQDAQRTVASPWAGSPSGQLVIDELFGLNLPQMTRTGAMTVPAVAKARRMVCDTLARQPLKAYKDGVAFPVQPTWLARSEGTLSPRMRAVWVLDDLFFYGWSLLALIRGAEGQVLDATRIAPDSWRATSTGIEIRNPETEVWEPVTDESSVCLIAGGMEGLLTVANRTIRAAVDLEQSWHARAKNPVPVVELRYTGDATLEPEEQEDVRKVYLKARHDPEGVVMTMPADWELHTHGDQALELFVQGRNAATLDIARFANMPGSMLDGSQVNGSSIDYENAGIGRNEFLDYTLRSWALPLEERLSQDDMTPRGTTIAFDLSGLRTQDTGTGPVLED